MDTGTGRLPDDQQASALAAADHRPGPERQVGLAQAAGPDLFKQQVESVHGLMVTEFPAGSRLWNRRQILIMRPHLFNLINGKR
ncbi:hypothetical protein D3C80_523270 [compost metagenome]